MTSQVRNGDVTFDIVRSVIVTFLGASGYELVVTSESEEETVQQISATSLTVTSLEAGSKYIFALKSIGDFGVRSREETVVDTWTGW